MYTLLIADDEADERILIRFLLNRFKDVFHILEAQNGREALELLSGRHVDVYYPISKCLSSMALTLSAESKR